MITFRPLDPSDTSLLWDMLYLAIYVPDGMAPPSREILQQPEVSRYVSGWGRQGDMGIAAFKAGAPQGAAWLRLFSEDEPGYGFVAKGIPELSIAVLASVRGQGIGTRLLTRLFTQAEGQFPAISLSVSGPNPALHLYQKMGFTTLKQEGESLTMLKSW